MIADTISLPTRHLDPALINLLQGLKVGERIRITQTLRGGAKTWTHEVLGSFRGINCLATGITTDRVVEDDIVVPTVHFTKDNGELTSIALDELTKVDLA